MWRCARCESVAIIGIFRFPEIQGEHDRQLAHRGIDRLAWMAGDAIPVVLGSTHGAQNIQR